MITLPARSPREIDDWELDWTDILTDTSLNVLDPIDEILDVSFSPVTNPARADIPAQRSFTDDTTTLWITGGLAGTKYILKVLVRTVGGREREAVLVSPTKKENT